MPGSRLDMHFINIGFTNWKKATQSLQLHNVSEQHRQAIDIQKLSNKPTVDVLLDQQKISEQQQHYMVLEKIIETAIFLLQKGLAFQGHSDQTGNFYELLELRAKDVPMLKDWLQRKRKWLTHDSQNEIISLIAKSVQKQIADQIKSCVNFSVISDGTQDIEGR